MAERARARSTRSPEQAFAEVLRRTRLRRHLSQEALAHASGYHRTYIGQLERGEKSPSLRTLFNLADALNVSATQLISAVESLRTS